MSQILAMRQERAEKWEAAENFLTRTKVPGKDMAPVRARKEVVVDVHGGYTEQKRHC